MMKIEDEIICSFAYYFVKKTSADKIGSLGE